MTKTLMQFNRRKKYLLCVDSDGCAMDTMTVKHVRCFGPCFADEWNLQGVERDVWLARWNEINLYERSRGINRFKGFAQILTEMFPQNADIKAFCKWTETAEELSESALNAQISVDGNPVFARALNWSRAVNQAISKLSLQEKMPFDGVREALCELSGNFDIAIVSSANYQAVVDEWRQSGLLRYVGAVATQQDGSKAHCIARLINKGYSPDCVVMVGDAVGDCRAAESNGVSFYPILVNREAESWQRICAVLHNFGAETCIQQLQKLKEDFYSNFK